MPKVYTYNAEFNPISFVDRIAPMRLYKEEYDKQQAAYEKMLEDTDDLGVLKDIAMDADSYNVYKSFQDEIESVADEMNSKGLSQDVRNRLLNLRRRQTNEINPLIEKQKTRADLVAEQRKYMETHPNAIFDVDYNQTPLSKIGKESTFTPYDLEKGYASIADAVYSNIMSNNGVDTTDYDKIKSQYNYDKLSPEKQKAVDDMIDLAKGKATATYQIYKDKEAMDRYRYRNKGVGSGSVSGTVSGAASVASLEKVLSGKTSGKYKLPSIGGLAIPVSVDKSGNVTVSGIDGKSHIISSGIKQRDETDEAYTDRVQKELFKAYYGHNYHDVKTLDNGSSVLILSDKVGDKTQYYIMNNKGKIVPIPNIKDGTILQEYEGKVYKYANGEAESVRRAKDGAKFSYDTSKYEINKDKLEVISSISQITNISKSIQQDLGIGDDSELSDFFNNGYEICKVPIVSKKNSDDIIGYKYFTRKRGSMDE